MYLRKFLMISASTLLFLTGCDLDPYYPNRLRGNIDDGVYTTKIGYFGSNEFEIEVPQAGNEYESVYLPTHEKYNLDYTFTSFGPMASDQGVYRVLVAKKNDMSLLQFKMEFMPIIIQIAAKGDEKQMALVKQVRTTANHRPAYFAVYKQELQSVYTYINNNQPGNVIYTHCFYFIDYGKYGVVIWVTSTTESGINGINKSNIRSVLQQKWWPLNRFVRSFGIV